MTEIQPAQPPPYLSAQPTQYFSAKQLAKIYHHFSASYITRHAKEFDGMRVGGGEHRAGRWLFTIEGFERGLRNFHKKRTPETNKN